MKTALRFLAASVVVCFLSACGPQSETVVEKIPIKVQKVVTVELHRLIGGGAQQVGMSCSMLAWQALTNGVGSIQVELLSGDTNEFLVYGIDPHLTCVCADTPGSHYLFSISGKGKASVRITFPNSPTNTSEGQIVLCEPLRLSL
jgi:hypothetical protein